MNILGNNSLKKPSLLSLLSSSVSSLIYNCYYHYHYYSGILLVSQLQQRKDLRGVPIKITTEYYKKARGTLKATSTATNLSNITKKNDVTVITDVYDRKNVLVSRTFVTWTIEPKAASSSSNSNNNNNNNNSSSSGGGSNSSSSSNDTKKKKK